MRMYATLAHVNDSNACIEVVYLKDEDVYRVTRYDSGQQWPVILQFDYKADAMQAAMAMAGIDPANVVAI